MINRYDDDQVKEVDAILALPPGAKKWRRAASLWLKTNPVSPKTGQTATEENALILQRNKMLRETRANKFGAGNDGMRFGLSMPAGMLQTIELFDPYVLAGKGDEAKANFGKLIKAFPEYQVLEKW